MTSVIIVTYRTGAPLWICLAHVLCQHGLKEVIIVNNGNPPETERYLQQIAKSYGEVKLLTGHGNVGFAKACNLGAAMASGDFVVLLNPDAVLLQPDALLNLTSVFSRAAENPVMLVGGVLRNEDGSEQRASRRNLMDPANALGEGLRLNRLWPKLGTINRESEPLPENPAEVPAISGACMVMKKADYDRIGGMDEGYFLHAEDMDLCQRVHLTGGSVWINPQVDLLHYRSTSDVSSLFVERQKAKSFGRYFRVYPGNSKALLFLVKLAAWARLTVRALLSTIGKILPERQLLTPTGVKQVQAILRGLQAETGGDSTYFPENQSVIVTGASTPIGLFSIGRLLARGCRVFAICHNSQIGFSHSNLTWLHGDLTKPDTLSVSKEKYDFALHAAPVWFAPSAIAWFQKMGVSKLVAFSSTSIVGKEKSRDAKERAMVQKLETSETALRGQAEMAGMKWTILRPTMIYGTGLDANISQIARTLDRVRFFPLETPALGKRAPVHADDLAKAALNALSCSESAGKTYDLSGGSIMPYRAMVDRVADTMAIKYLALGLPGFSLLASLLHPFAPRIIPSPEVFTRMKHDLVFPDESVTTDLKVTPRKFLEGGMADLGEDKEDRCRFLLPVPQDS